MADYKKPDAQSLRQKLTPEQFEVTQQCGTEPPFRNPYWDNKKPGIYVDIVSGEPLFSSLDKYDSGTGWPSFTKPLEKQNVTYHQENDIYARTEVRSTHADSHLGHVFDDGPGPAGQRYCMNSASMRFIPVENLQAEGYGKYLSLFGKSVNPTESSSTDQSAQEIAVFAGGCFWGVEEIFRKIPGVLQTTVGYTGGTTPSPRYKEVCSGETGHAEALEIAFNPKEVSYEELVRIFFRMHDPTTPNRQHNDVGTQYRSAIFTETEEQAMTARKVIADLSAQGIFKKPIVTEVLPASVFHSAEPEHQDYLQKNPGGYNCHILRPG